MQETKEKKSQVMDIETIRRQARFIGLIASYELVKGRMKVCFFDSIEAENMFEPMAVVDNKMEAIKFMYGYYIAMRLMGRLSNVARGEDERFYYA